jgi:signal-transduction protein with cAMP-binding, CBS, and nucleotidyltransferase domain
MGALTLLWFSNVNVCWQQYKYLRSIVNVSNSIEEEIKGRIALCTKADNANLKFFKSRLVTKQSKLELYRTVIRPIVTCLRNMGIERSHNSESISL